MIPLTSISFFAYTSQYQHPVIFTLTVTMSFFAVCCHSFALTQSSQLWKTLQLVRYYQHIAGKSSHDSFLCMEQQVSPWVNAGWCSKLYIAKRTCLLDPQKVGRMHKYGQKVDQGILFWQIQTFTMTITSYKQYRRCTLVNIAEDCKLKT